MRTAEFRLRFYSEEEADKACKICRREAEGTGWQEAVQAEDWMVWADSCVVSDDPDFSTDSFEDGEMLFQRMCFRIASEMPETTVTGSCNITDSKDNERIRITAGAENDGQGDGHKPQKGRKLRFGKEVLPQRCNQCDERSRSAGTC